MLISPDDRATAVLDWGTIKWFVNPTDVEDAQTTLGEVIILPGRGHATHAHPGVQEVIYVIEGEGRQTVGESGPFAVRSGDAVFIPVGAEHSTFNTGWRALRLIVTYSPGGEERALRNLPDFDEVAPGLAPTWVRAPSDD
jgi:oxalate decarboxylase/phosphoglucose isomerase-like protein (cupin superfamily)